jgi:hypothetical protein
MITKHLDRKIFEKSNLHPYGIVCADILPASPVCVLATKFIDTDLVLNDSSMMRYVFCRGELLPGRLSHLPLAHIP